MFPPLPQEIYRSALFSEGKSSRGGSLNATVYGLQQRVEALGATIEGDGDQLAEPWQWMRAFTGLIDRRVHVMS
jgi:hypothetical protein